MTPSIRPPAALFTLLAFAAGILLWSPSHGQDLDNVTFTAQGNMSGTPAVGVDYRFTDQTSVRFSLGYFQFNDRFSPCSYAEPGVFCEAIFYRATTHQVSSSLSGLYRLIRWGEASTYTGLTIQHLYAWAPERTGAGNSGLADADVAGNRVSVSGLVGLSIELDSWLTLFGELGLGYVRGLPVRTFRADLDATVDRWGVTHVSPGLRVSF